jgi:glycogen phosphorylase
VAKDLHAWRMELERHWGEVHFGTIEVRRAADRWTFEVGVHLGAVAASSVRVELYAEPLDASEPVRTVMERGRPIAGATNGHVYGATASASRPSWHYTPRVVPDHPEARIPMEAPLIRWPR